MLLMNVFIQILYKYFSYNIFFIFFILVINLENI